jgi:hypothetical protein
MSGSEQLLYKANPYVSCRVEGDEEVILYNPDLDDFILVNSSALLIWRYIDKPRSIEEICAHMIDSYSETPVTDVLHEDITTFLDELGHEYLIMVDHEP